MLTIYHNTRCRKSREGLEILKNSGKNFRIREYIKEPLDETDLRRILSKLNITPLQLVRQNEKLWKEKYKGKDLSDNEIIMIMAAHPGLIERPIVEAENTAVIGRPSSEIEKII